MQKGEFPPVLGEFWTFWAFWGQKQCKTSAAIGVQDIEEHSSVPLRNELRGQLEAVFIQGDTINVKYSLQMTSEFIPEGH